MPSIDPQQWNDYFNQAATEYLKQTAGVTRNISQQVLTLLPPITTSSVIHDNAAGPGVVTFDILATATKNDIQPPTIHATDFSSAMVDQIQAVIEEQKLSTVTAQVMDGSDLSQLGDDMFTHSITNFGIFMFPDPVAGAAHILRTLKPGGKAAITVWKYPGNIVFINEVLQALAPGTEEWAPMKTKDWLEEAHLRGILETAGFKKENIECMEKEVVWPIDNMDETVELMNGKFFDKAKEALNEEQKGRWADMVREKLVERNGKGIRMVAHAALARK
jgi:ubiquinone/menaquinone biosynthesis C-methylase UbiE